MYVGLCQPSKDMRSHALDDDLDLLQKVKDNPTDVQLMVRFLCNIIFSDDGSTGEACGDVHEEWSDQ